MSFPRYPKYKDSGVEWLGEVPEHWDVAPLKRLARLADRARRPKSDMANPTCIASDIGRLYRRILAHRDDVADSRRSERCRPVTSLHSASCRSAACDGATRAEIGRSAVELIRVVGLCGS